MTHKIAWRISLNNGETHTEGIGRFQEIENQASPWQQVLAYLAENNLQITSLFLVTEDNRTFNLPSAGKNPKFRRFDMSEKPTNYRCERTVGQNRNKSGEAEGQKDWFTIAVAEYQFFELQFWVDENDTRNCWALVVPKEDNK